MNKVSEHLRSDPIMDKLISKFGELTLTISETLFIDLVSSIIGQQLSKKAADTIYKRVLVLVKDDLTAESILAMSNDAMRQAGVSQNKINYIKNLALSVGCKDLLLETVSQLDNEEVIQQLSKLKGIGRWTAEMFLIFSLAREDVFSHGDGGLNRSLNRLYSRNSILTKNEIIEITNKWIPYRSYASLYLWKALDNEVNSLR